MRVVNKRYYYFDEKDKIDFEVFLVKNLMRKGEFAKKCGISLTLLTLLFNGKRAITKEVADLFTKNGFRVVIGE